jgi:hypothetical protein
MKKLFAWVARNERHLSTVVFVGGFILDNFAYERVDLPWVNILFMSFLVAAALCIIVSHLLHRENPDAKPSWKHPFYTLVPIAAQFFIGGLLSGCVIFYARSATFGVSWPFLILLFAVFVGNEVLQKYRERLAFHVILFFFTLYAYAIFALPLRVGTMSSFVFLESGAVSVIIFALFLAVLWAIGPKRLLGSLKRILVSCGVILIVVNVSYFTGILPPLPLALKDAGIYHAIVKTADGYSVQAEDAVWSLFAPDIIHHMKGTPLYAYSAVFAPVSLSTPIVHRWERYDDAAHTWKTVAAIAFPINGGRDNGYRGYSTYSDLPAGAWRVSIETLNGSVLGRVRFDIEDATLSPALHTELK